MGAASPQRAQPLPERRPRPRLHLVPAPRPRPQRRHDGVWALFLATLLSVGVLGVLFLNTAMQQQADRIATQRQLIATLTTQAQSLRTAVEEAADPKALAARARQLHMHPVRRFRFLAVNGRTVRQTRPA